MRGGVELHRPLGHLVRTFGVVLELSYSDPKSRAAQTPPPKDLSRSLAVVPLTAEASSLPLQGALSSVTACGPCEQRSLWLMGASV